ncbi:hypothetical protein B0H99_108109 [Planomicrobium soli]|uniref:Uncharacterized protein n=1 Tax=Planomicrobium soli TaxID=1176648 RepID=A0A2P8GMK4_9BACL|nr:hypothetical protein [Planomicrobium soli]PSL35204.1 hypothetical protein B0H99_108109 [Planomicrobium soli]
MVSFSIGFKHNVSASDKVRMQQEANLVIAKITEKHRNGECYNLKNENGKLFFISYKIGTATKCSEIQSQTLVTESNYIYKIDAHGFKGNPKKCDLNLKLIVSKDKAVVEIDTTISRIKTAKGSNGTVEGACGT